MRIHYITTHNKILFILQIVFFGDNPNPPATCLISRLNNPQLFTIFLLQLIYLEPILVRGEYLGHRALVKPGGVIVGCASAFHGLIVFPHHVFATELKAVREVVDALVESEVFNLFGSACVHPHEVEFFSFRFFETTFFEIGNYTIVAVGF